MIKRKRERYNEANENESGESKRLIPMQMDKESYIPIDTFLKAPKQRFVNCSCMRTLGLCMTGFVLGLIYFITSVIWRIYGNKFGVEIWMTLNLVIYIVLSGLLTLSYIQTIITDPGSVPVEWEREVSSNQNVSSKYVKCRKTDLFKPPRSQYCQLSSQVVLNYDHYCPWVNNAVGFFNRKFFILFVFYGLIGCAHSSLLLLPYGWQVFGFTKSNGRHLAAKSHGSSSVTNEITDIFYTEVGPLMAFVFSATFTVSLVFFTSAHFYMTLRNQTSIQRQRESEPYDIGKRKNFEQVFGKNPWLWFIPIYGNGPVGDGVHWLRRDGTWDGLERLEWMEEQGMSSDSEVESV